MTKHDAVDRLMALATEKRADRIPGVSPGGAAEASPQAQTASADSRPEFSAEKAVDLAPLASPAVNRGRQIFQIIRPLLPAIAGAMRLVDHGAVQAAARLLPLLGGVNSTNPSSSTSATAATNAAQEQFARGALELQTAHSDIRKKLSTLELQTLAAEEQIARMRTQLDRLLSEQLTTRTDAQNLAQRTRLLTAGTIILIMLVVAQMIVLVISMRG